MKIEKIKTTEFDAVSRLVAEAFYTKFSKETKLTQERLQKILKLLWISEAENSGMTIYTVKLRGEVVGAFGYTSVNKRQIRLKTVAKGAAVVKTIGLKECLSFLKVARQTSRKLDKGEWYIDFIVVKKKFRNQNIGHKIMTELEERLELDTHAQKLSLYVLKGNEPARHLYEKVGFIVNPDVIKKDYDFMVKKRTDYTDFQTGVL